MTNHEPRAESQDETMCNHCGAAVGRFQDWCDADCEACDYDGYSVYCVGVCGKAAHMLTMALL